MAKWCACARLVDARGVRTVHSRTAWCPEPAPTEPAQRSTDGIRPHRPMSEAEHEEARRIAELPGTTPPLDFVSALREASHVDIADQEVHGNWTVDRND